MKRSLKRSKTIKRGRGSIMKIQGECVGDVSDADWG